MQTTLGVSTQTGCHDTQWPSTRNAPCHPGFLAQHFPLPLTKLPFLSGAEAVTTENGFRNSTPEGEVPFQLGGVRQNREKRTRRFSVLFPRNGTFPWGAMYLGLHREEEEEEGEGGGGAGDALP